MKINTSRFGTLDMPADKVIHMPLGMLGFPDQKRFVILQHKENSPFLWYQSLDDPGLAFVLTNPFLFEPDYKVDLKHAIKEMSWNGDGKNLELELYVVVNIPKGSPGKMTGNFIGPVLVNPNVGQAVQVVVAESIYTHKHPLLKGQER